MDNQGRALLGLCSARIHANYCFVIPPRVVTNVIQYYYSPWEIDADFERLYFTDLRLLSKFLTR